MTSSSKKLEEAVEELQKRIAKLRPSLAKDGVVDEHIEIKVEKTQAHFKRIFSPGERDTGEGHFFLQLKITSLKQDVYVPMSIASGKKTVGFIYHIEGTGQGEIQTTDIIARGDDVTKITLGTLLFVRIPAGKTAEFRLNIVIGGATSKEFKVGINQVSYKLDPSDSRYIKLETDISTKIVKFI